MTRPPRIVHVLSNLQFGGTETNTLRIVAALAQRGFEQRIVCLSGNINPELRDNTAAAVTAPQGRKRLPGAIGLVASVLREFGPDVVHGRAYRTWRECTIAHVLTAGRRRIIQSFHGDTTFQLQRTRRKVWARGLQSATDAVVAVSEDLARQLAEQWGVPRLKIQVIRNGVDVCRFRPPHDVAAARERLGISPNTLVIGSIGSLRSVKNHTLLLRAHAKLKRKLRDCLVIVVGDGPLRAGLEALARQLGTAEAVRFCGYQKNVMPYFAAMDIYVQPSLTEGSPTAVLEAMACGLPVVAGHSPGCAELHAATGLPWLVDGSDERVLTRMLLRLAGDRALRRATGRQARAAVKASFGLDDMVQCYERLYRKLAGTPASAAVRAAV